MLKQSLSEANAPDSDFVVWVCCGSENLPAGPIGSFVAVIGRRRIFPAPKSQYCGLAAVSRPEKENKMPPSFFRLRMAGIIVGLFDASAAISDLQMMELKDGLGIQRED
jgi:hypothetical protein